MPTMPRGTSPHAVPTKVCRGCGGNGIGTQVTPRQVQIIEEHQPVALIRARSRFIRIASITDQSTASGFFHGPLAIAVEQIEDRVAAGWRAIPVDGNEWFVRELLAHWKDWRCSWCHGTGVPQLSVNTLRGGRRVER